MGTITPGVSHSYSDPISTGPLSSDLIFPRPYATCSKQRQEYTMTPRTRTRQPSHEKNDRWATVNKYALRRLNPSDSSYYDAINHAIELSESRGLPSIEVSALQGKFLATQCQIANAKHVLELGTLGGISSIWFASSGPDVSVTTIEIEEHRKAVAEEAIAHAGLTDRIEVLLGAGVDVLPKLRKEVESGKRPKYDFVFIDADKQNSLNYFNEAVPMSRSRACIVVDNVVRKGKLADDEAAKQDDRILGARRVVEAAGKDERLMGTTLLQTVGEKNYDGFLMCVVK